MLTCIEQSDALQAGVFGSINVQHLEALDLLLERADVVHEGHDAIGAEWRRVQACGGQEWCDMQRHGALSGAQDEQLRPSMPQQGYLISDLQEATESVFFCFIPQ